MQASARLGVQLTNLGTRKLRMDHELLSTEMLTADSRIKIDTTKRQYKQYKRPQLFNTGKSDTITDVEVHNI